MMIKVKKKNKIKKGDNFYEMVARIRWGNVSKLPFHENYFLFELVLNIFIWIFKFRNNMLGIKNTLSNC